MRNGPLEDSLRGWREQYLLGMCGGSGELQECSKCEAALSCGEACQLKAWKDEHNGACPILNVKLANFYVCLKAVDDANPVDRIGMLKGMRLDLNVDYLTMYTIHRLPNAFDGDPLGDALGERSMKYFYENLARVISGEWWLFSENEVPSAECFMELFPPNTNGKILRNFLWYCVYLSYDYFGCTARTEGVDEAKPAMVTAHFENLVLRNLVQPNERLGTALPRQIFLETYDNGHKPVGEGSRVVARDTVRRQGKDEVLNHLRRCEEVYHK